MDWEVCTLPASSLSVAAVDLSCAARCGLAIARKVRPNWYAGPDYDHCPDFEQAYLAGLKSETTLNPEMKSYY